MSAKPFLAAALGLALLAPSVASAEATSKKKPATSAKPPTSTTTTTSGAINVGNEPTKAETTKSEGPNRVLLGGGALLFGIPYVSSVLVAATSSRSSDNNLFIPVAGPWIALGTRDCTEQRCESEFLSGTMLVLDGFAQGIGALAVAASFVVPEEKTTIKLGSTAKMTVGPSKVGQGGYGVGAFGEF